MRGFAVAGFVALVMVFSRPAVAGCTRTPGMLVLYRGTIGSAPVRATLAFGVASVRGRVSAGPDFTDVVLRGVQLGREIVLNTAAITQTPTVRAVFTTCSSISGTWRDARSGRLEALALREDAEVGGTLAHRYGAAGVTSDALVDARVRAFRRAVIGGDASEAAAYVAYPLHANSGVTSTVIANRAQFLAQYDRIFPAEVRHAIASAVPADLFARDQGVMLGSGVVWFDSDGRAISINRR